MYLHRFHFPTEFSVFRGFVAVLTALFLVNASRADAETYILSTGDKLQIEVLENQKIGGGYTIAVDGTVSVPGIGVLTAKGQSLRDFEETLRKAAAEKISNPSVSVQIASYRPFYILGDVGKAGSYAYAPDLTVMEAVAIAGGFGRQVTGDALTRAIAVSQARKSLLEGQVDLLSSKVNLARLRAEKEMAETFEYTPVAEEELPDSDLTAIIEEAQALFHTRQNSFKTRLEKLENTMAKRTEETESFENQIVLQRERLETSQAELQEIQEARDQGIVSADRLNNVVRYEQNVRAQTMQIETLRRQAEVGAAEVESQIAELVVSREQELDRDILALTETIERLEVRAREDRALLANTGASSGVSSDGKSDFRFELHRDGAQLPDPIELTSRINPGDTLFVIMDIRN